MLSDYWRFFILNKRFLAFGFFMAFLSSPGQTYVIGVYGPEIQSLFSLDNGQWGNIYMLGTLSSAALISWSGAFIDRVKLRSFTLFCVLGLVVACLVVASVNSLPGLVVAVFLLRQFGQGLISHTAMTTMTRNYSVNRGKAIAIAALGFAAGEAILPGLSLFIIENWSWRIAYQSTAIFVLFSVPLLLWLLQGGAHRTDRVTTNTQTDEPQAVHAYSYNRLQVISELRFYLIIPGIIAPSLILTAMFFFPAEIAKAKGWKTNQITGHYWIYSIASVVTVLSSGSLIDRLTAKKIAPMFLLPLAGAMLALAVSDHLLVIGLYMILLGISSGLYFTGTGALWAELYGVKYLGEIKSLASAIMVFSSALGPALVGHLLTQNYSMEQICLFLAGLCLVAITLLFYSLNGKHLQN